MWIPFTAICNVLWKVLSALKLDTEGVWWREGWILLKSWAAFWRKWHLHRTWKNRVEEMGSDWLSDRAFFWMRDVLLHSVNSKQPFIEDLLHICRGMLLDILLWTGRPPTTQNHTVQNGRDAKSEKHAWSHAGRIHLRQRELCWLLTFALNPLHWQWGPSSHTQNAVIYLESCSLINQCA